MRTRTIPVLLLALAAPAALAQTTFTSVDDGNWSDPAIWDQPTAPTPGSNVVIEAFDDVVLDVDAEVLNLTLAENGDLFFNGSVSVALTVRGDVVLGPGTRFRPNDSDTGGFLAHTLILEGDLTGEGELDFRRGSNGSNTSAGVETTFSGTTNTVIDLTGPSSAQLLDNFSPIGRANEFNSLTFAKTGGARVILQSSIESTNNSSTGPGLCTFDSGVVEVADGQALVCASSSNSTVTQNDAGSYVIGTFGRGFGNGGAATSFFPVGDESRARPLVIESEATGGSTPYLLVTLVNESANALAATYSGDLEQVSELRYYRLQYDDEGTGATGVLTDIDVTYNDDDGVDGGNSTLRVATSADGGSTWVERGGDGHVTVASGSTIESATVSIPLTDEETIFLALGDGIGGVNPLPVELAAFDAVADGAALVVRWETAGETSNAGFSLDLRRAGTDLWETPAYVPGAGTTAESRRYAERLEGLLPGRYTVRLRQHDLDGTVTVGPEVEAALEADGLALAMRGAHPFTGEAAWVLTGARGAVHVEVFDALGRRVAVLHEGEAAAAQPLAFTAAAPGLYVLRVKDDARVLTERFVVAR